MASTDTIPPAGRPVVQSFYSDSLDLSDKEFFLVQASGTADDPDLVVCADGEVAIGTVSGHAAAINYATYPGPVPVEVGGIIRVKCAAAFSAANTPFKASSGEAIPATTGDMACGIMLYTQADNDIGLALLMPHEAD